MTARPLRNRDAVAAELDWLRALVRGESGDEQAQNLTQARELLDGRSSLGEIADGFGLTGFERSVLLLAAGPDLVGESVADIATLGAGDRITFAGAMSVLPGAHWSAVTPPGPLRHWGLVELLDPVSAVRSPLTVDERVLNHLAGTGHLDVRLAAVGRPVPAAGWLPATLSAAVGEVVAAWRADRPVVLNGMQRGNVYAVFAGAAERVGLTGYALDAGDVPADPLARWDLLRRMERETVLGGAAWLVDLTGGPADGITALGGLHAPVALLSVQAVPDAVEVRIDRLEVAERREVLSSALRRAGCTVPAADSDVAAAVFDVSLPEIEEIAGEVADGAALWAACRARVGSHPGGLATLITPRATWDDLVLPEAQMEQLRALSSSVRHRSTVLDDWGFAQRGPRGLGSTALFTGPSGTGKSLAAEVIARDLDLDLLQVDLSRVVSKWLGETEKNLARVFDAAENGGALLLFDEADALFGKRTEVRDSHDRYANIEVGYLLQRMEQFRGLAILTTNARSGLDPAFLRRLRTVVTFPYPDPGLRERLWAGVFPADAPTDGVQPRQLADIDLPGGGIAAVALTAAYLAAEDGGGVGEEHVRTAARWELAKSGRVPRRGAP